MMVVKAMLILQRRAVSIKLEVNWLATWREQDRAPDVEQKKGNEREDSDDPEYFRDDFQTLELVV